MELVTNTLTNETAESTEIDLNKYGNLNYDRPGWKLGLQQSIRNGWCPFGKRANEKSWDQLHTSPY